MTRLPASLFGGFRRASAQPIEEVFSHAATASEASFVVFSAPKLPAAEAEAMQAKLTAGKVALGLGGTEEALKGRYDASSSAPVLMPAAKLGLDDESPLGPPSSTAWQQASIFYCNCARIGGLVLAADAPSFSAWMRAHPMPGLPDGRLFALVGKHLLAVHTQSARGAHSVADGLGCMIWASGAFFHGAFLNGKRHGQGTYVAASGDRYVGAWVHGKKQGQGRIEFTNGNVYDGMWEANERTGGGVQTYPDGGKYIGDFVKGRREGVGNFIFGQTGVRFTGEWRDEHMEGPGVQYESGGKRIQGTWSKSKRDGDFDITYAGSPKVEHEVWRNGQLVDFSEGTRTVSAAEVAAADEADAEMDASDGGAPTC